MSASSTPPRGIFNALALLCRPSKVYNLNKLQALPGLVKIVLAIGLFL